MTTNYSSLVSNLKQDVILEKWPEVTPLNKITGVMTSTGSSEASDKVFEGHDEEQIRLMDELCVVLDYDDKPIGAGTKKLCHLMENIDGGLLHRAFSVFLFNEEGKLLIQQRADKKITFPGMWTNTCCSHPLSIASELGISNIRYPENINELSTAVEGVKIAAQRKLDHELGIPLSQSPLQDFSFLTRIHYKSPSGPQGSKWGEHEIDYILILRTKNNITINSNDNEVKDYKFVTKDELKQMFENKDLIFTPWFKLICDTFLFKWWNNLKNLDEFKDEEIHRML